MKRRIGERRILLGLLGAPFVVFGIGFLRSDGAETRLAPSVEQMANSLFGWLWIIVGLTAIVAMFASGSRRVIEEVGYGLLFIPPFVWMSAYLITLISGGGFLAFSAFVTTGTFVVLILYLARYMRNR